MRVRRGGDVWLRDGRARDKLKARPSRAAVWRYVHRQHERAHDALEASSPRAAVWRCEHQYQVKR